MALPINIEDLLNKRKIEGNQIEFKKGLNQTGIPTIQEEMQKNGSPRATIETNEERNFINVFIPIHEGCEETVILNGTQDVPQGDTQDDTQDVPQGVPQGVPQDDLDNWIEEQIRKNPKITTKELGNMCGLNSKTIKRHIVKLPHIKYIGSGYSGHWEIVE